MMEDSLESIIQYLVLQRKYLLEPNPIKVLKYVGEIQE